MPLSTDLPTDTIAGAAAHTDGHNATNGNVNAVATAVNGHETRLGTAEVAVAAKPDPAILIPSPIMQPSAFGGPTSAGVTTNGLWPVQRFSDATNQGLVAAQLIPVSAAVDFDCRVLWCSIGGGTGNVRWEVTAQVYNPAADAAGTPQVLTATATGGADNAPQYTSVGTFTVDVSDARLLHVRIWRLTSDGADTLPNEAGLIGLAFMST